MANEPRLCDAAKAKWQYTVGDLYEVAVVVPCTPAADG
jgi:hypothetical protein